MRISLLSALAATLATFAPAQTCVSLTAANTAVTENFNSLANSGTSSTVPAGWAFVETGTNANTTYGVTTGSATMMVF